MEPHAPASETMPTLPMYADPVLLAQLQTPIELLATAVMAQFMMMLPKDVLLSSHVSKTQLESLKPESTDADATPTSLSVAKHVFTVQLLLNGTPLN